jgi:hypothetical protein
MKRLFDMSFRYTGEGTTFAVHFEKLVDSFLKENMEKYDIIDLENIAHASISIIFSEQKLDIR